MSTQIITIALVAPTVSIDPVASPTTTGTQTITGTATGIDVAVAVNGQPVSLIGGAWSYEAELVPGINIFTAVAVDLSSSASSSASIEYQPITVPTDLPDMMAGDGTNWKDGDLFAGNGGEWVPVDVFAGTGEEWAA